MQPRYGEYGVPFGMAAGDVDGDGDVNSGDTADTDQIQTWINGSTYDARGDLDLDGDVDTTDKSNALGYAGTVLGWGKLSMGASAGGNRKGYAGYEFDGVLAYSIWHVRNRVLNSDLGRWYTRDRTSYVAGASLYNYATRAPLIESDPLGLISIRVRGSFLQLRHNNCNPGFSSFATFAEDIFYSVPANTSAWLVRKVEVSSTHTVCKTNQESSFKRIWWEASPITLIQTPPGEQSEAEAGDNVTVQAWKNRNLDDQDERSKGRSQSRAWIRIFTNVAADPPTGWGTVLEGVGQSGRPRCANVHQRDPTGFLE